MKEQDITAAVQAISSAAAAVFAFLAWLKGRTNEKRIKVTHDLVNSSSTALLEISKGVAFREGVEHADATTAADLSAHLAQAEAETKKINGGGSP